MSSNADFDKLAEAFEKVADAWNGLSDEQQSQALSALDSVGAEMQPGTDDESEFERSAKKLATAAAAAQAAAGLMLLSVALAPAAPVVSGIGIALGILAGMAKQLTPERTQKLAAWLASKAPKFYGVLCKNPTLLYGLSYIGNPEGPWYMLSSCSVPDAGMMTLGPEGIVSAADTDLSSSSYPFDLGSSSSSSSSSSSDKQLLLVGAGLLLALFS